MKAAGRPRVYDDRGRAVLYLRPDQIADLRRWARKVRMSGSAAVAAVLVTFGVIRP